MATFRPIESDFLYTTVEGKRRAVLLKSRFDAFNPALLGLGDLARPATRSDAIAAIFALDGLPALCNHMHSHLDAPLFIREFLAWFMQQLKMEMKRQDHIAGAILWSPLPFFVKFVGDGLLVLWDTSQETDVARRNILANARVICANYQTGFLPEIAEQLSDPPPLLRCGLARGTVYSVGDGNDFFGACITMAARLQRLPGITFSFNQRGFNLEDLDKHDWIKKEIIIHRVSIAGFGNDEWIGLLQNEWDALPPEDRKPFQPL